MILFMALLCALLAVVAIALIAAIIAGTGFIVVFGDVVVFALLVWAIITLIKRHKK